METLEVTVKHNKSVLEAQTLMKTLLRGNEAKASGKFKRFAIKRLKVIWPEWPEAPKEGETNGVFSFQFIKFPVTGNVKIAEDECTLSTELPLNFGKLKGLKTRIEKV